MINVEIITIGDELLIGQVIDTNSAWMGQELNKLGFDVKYKTTIGDNEEDILNAFEKAFSRVSIILVTGGIGPTKDDITKKTLCNYFNTKLIFDEHVLKNIEELIAGYGRSVNELTRNQAYVPENCTVIQNKMGTAPVTWFEKNGSVLVSMPGVPYEMKWIMSEKVLPKLKEKFNESDFIQHQTFWVSNYSESMLAAHLENFEDELPGFLKLAYLPASGMMRLRITGKYADEVLLTKTMEEQKSRLVDLLQSDIIAEEDKSINELLADLLTEKGLSLSLAESCTGGYIAHLLTSLAGSSQYFKGSIVSYANETKENILNVTHQSLETYGAVSKEVVEQMARNAQTLFQTDCSISTSGIAGPDGGSEEKPVGTVWICVCYGNKQESVKYTFGRNRENNIMRTSNTALLMLYNMIQDKEHS